jgi:hypothetical protein
MHSFDTWWFGRRGRDRSGSTAVVGLVHGQELTVGNLGKCQGSAAAVQQQHCAEVVEIVYYCNAVRLAGLECSLCVLC